MEAWGWERGFARKLLTLFGGAAVSEGGRPGVGMRLTGGKQRLLKIDRGAGTEADGWRKTIHSQSKVGTHPLIQFFLPYSLTLKTSNI